MKGMLELSGIGLLWSFWAVQWIPALLFGIMFLIAELRWEKELARRYRDPDQEVEDE